MSLGTALDAGTRRLRGAGVETAELDAELLLRHVLGWDRATLFARGREPLEPGAGERFAALVEARAARRPLQHLTGVQQFWRLPFQVTPDVLVPRPETELLVEQSLGALAGSVAPLVVDVGTGSGCIAVSIAVERPDARVLAIDISPAALEVARANARNAGVLERLELRQGDLLAPVAELFGRVQLVVSNPPYVGLDEWGGLAPEVRDHEPRLALVPPSGDPLEIYGRLAGEAARALAVGGRLALELGAGSERPVAERLARAGLHVSPAVPDLRGIPRVLVAER